MGATEALEHDGQVPGSGKKRVVVVGLGMVGIAFMYVTSDSIYCQHLTDM